MEKENERLKQTRLAKARLVSQVAQQTHLYEDDDVNMPEIYNNHDD